VLTPTMELWARWAVPKASSNHLLESNRHSQVKWVLEIEIILTDEDIRKLGKVGAELINALFRGLDLLSLGILAASLLLGVEAQVLQENNLAVLGVVDDLLNLWSDAVWSEGDAAAEKLLELWNDRLERELLVDLSIGAAQVGHQDNSLGTVVDGILDGWDSTGNTLCVGDVLLGVEGNVEVDLFTTPLSMMYFTRG
jgi:hypothetical protein